MLYLQLLVAAIVPLAKSWGPKGHQIATSVACKLMQSSASMWTRKLLKVMDLCDGMNAQNSFADDIGKTDGTWLYHFVNTPYRVCSAYEFERDCGDPTAPLSDRKCLVTGIAKYISDLVSEEASPSEQQTALKMLIHLMADLHQPMHISFKEDRGGNFINLESPAMTLHEVWDWKIIEDVNAEEFISGFVNTGGLKDHASLFQVSDPQDVVRWLSEIVSEISFTYTCPNAYRDGEAWIESRDSLDAAYMASRQSMAMALLERAGYRMAALFRNIASVWSKRERDAAPAIPAAVIPPVTFETVNPYACLTMDDIDFIPEEVALSFTAPVVRPEGRAKREPQPDEILNGVNLSSLVLLNRPRSKQYFVTALGASVKEVEAFHSVTVEFPRNNRANRSVVLLFDLSVFSMRALVDENFLRAVIYKLRGVKGNSAVVPAGKSVPNIRQMNGEFSDAIMAATRAARTGDNEMRVHTAPSGAQFLVVGGISRLLPESVEKITVKHNLTKQIAAGKFGASLSEEVLVEKYALSVIAQKCASIVRMRTDQMSFFTTENSIRKSNEKINKPFRGLLYDVVGLNDVIRTVIVDTDLIETTMTNDIQRALLKCAINGGKDVDVYHMLLRPTIYAELEEMRQRVADMKENKPIASTLIKHFFHYPHPIVTGISVVEWTLN